MAVAADGYDPDRRPVSGTDAMIPGSTPKDENGRVIDLAGGERAAKSGEGEEV